ncbi:MAG: DEAD/DEAH box helicase [Prevotellaceae bacterium]|nr:DEAD/DEAH box helicase [Candidatus Faecinaster equi]
MRDTAISLLPEDKVERDRIFNGLGRGKAILSDEDQMNMYLLSYGKMHQAKLFDVFDDFYASRPDLFSSAIELYDWGCGQGTASICFLDWLNQKGLKCVVTKINLVEPSESATNRATDVLRCFGKCSDIAVIRKTFDELASKDFTKSNGITLHLFSNILDVEFFNLANFTKLVQETFRGENYFVCVGPYYANNVRVDDFIAAIKPDTIYACYDKDLGEWKNDWTISLRTFYKKFDSVEDVDVIQERINETHKRRQLFAGYILDAVSEEAKKLGPDVHEGDIDCLLRTLSSFDVVSNNPLDDADGCDSKYAVLANIISRGLPTRAPILLERVMSNAYDISEESKDGPNIEFHSQNRINCRQIWDALHVIDPRFTIEEYNRDKHESPLEKSFIDKIYSKKSRYLVQLLEPQRPLHSIIQLPNKNFVDDQRVDFCLEVPYGKNSTGFILELDGKQYHSSIIQREYDRLRDETTAENGMSTLRIDELNAIKDLSCWYKDEDVERYLHQLSENLQKSIEGDWKTTLEIVLSPLAIARVERMLVQAVMSKALDVNAPTWKIAVIERDVPCAAIAIEDFQEHYNKLAALDGSYTKLPNVDLTIVSTREFSESPLHLDYNVTESIPCCQFDLCIDVSVLMRDGIDTHKTGIDAKTFYVVRSSHYKKQSRTVCSAESIEYQPLVVKDSVGLYEPIAEREANLTYFLQNIFRKRAFRKGQLPILSRALSGKTTIGLLPTGGGKSLTYQLASILQPGVTIIVDPLVSLMVDQKNGLQSCRIDSCDCVHSRMTGAEKAEKLKCLQNGSLQMMLLSPERYMMENFRQSLRDMTEKNHIYFSYGVIDEVHCVSEWGHDFRTAYLHLGRNMITCMTTKSGEPLPIIGLTATASFDVLADVERELTLGDKVAIDSETIVRPENDTRPEINYRIIEVKTDYGALKSRPNNPYLLESKNYWDIRNLVSTTKQAALESIISTDVAADINEINYRCPSLSPADFSVDEFFSKDQDDKYKNAGIVFCPHTSGGFGVKKKDEDSQSGVSEFLRTNLQETLSVSTFIGGDDPEKDMKSFKENDSNLMVATKAFGMGIDKPNVRFTVHINHPSSVEGYVQEAGRGGRDRNNAISYVLYDPTEYIELSADIINDIWHEVNTVTGYNINWLFQFSGQFVLVEDFVNFCLMQGCQRGISEKVIEFCRKKGFIQNVDKGIDLWFHNNSFKGAYKEKEVLHELTTALLNAQPTKLTLVQNEIRQLLGNEDICLRPDTKKDAIKVLSEENKQHQYGYIFLNSLCPTYGYRYSGFDLNLCTQICNAIIGYLLNNYPNATIANLNTPAATGSTTTGGIYSALSRIDYKEYTFVTVSWINLKQQNSSSFYQEIVNEISNIATNQGWNNINNPIKLHKISTFEDLLKEIAYLANDTRWLTYHQHSGIYSKLKQIFASRRDKSDTDKAIYRLCCIGLVEDVKIDYLSETYELKIRKKTDSEYRSNMLNYFRKYYSAERAEKKVAEIDLAAGNSYIDKCIDYLTSFIYDNLEKKRLRAIDDMRLVCEGGIRERYRFGNDDWIKEFIHLYFNSKYARQDYEVDGVDYSLSKDTDELGKDGFDVVQKYIDITNRDSSGSEVDNVKHLYGATLLSLRAHPDNAALLLLLSYCINMLGDNDNDALKQDFERGYMDGIMALYSSGWDNIWDSVNEFNAILLAKAKNVVHAQSMIDKNMEALMILIHEDQFNNFTEKYLK